MIANFVGQSRDRRGHQASSRHRRSLSWESGGGMTILEPRALLTDTTVLVAAIPPPATPAPDPAATAPPLAPPANPAIQPTTDTTTSSTKIWTSPGTYYVLDTTITSTIAADGSVRVTTTTINQGSDQPVYSITISYPAPQPGQPSVPTITEMTAWGPYPGSPFTTSSSQPASTFPWDNTTVILPNLPNFPAGYTITTTTDSSLDANGSYAGGITLLNILDANGNVVYTAGRIGQTSVWLTLSL